MCLSIPGKVVSIKGQQAKVKQNTHYHWVDISTLNNKVSKGDYLLTYQAAAINKITAVEAEEILELVDSAGDARVKGAD